MLEFALLLPLFLFLIFFTVDMGRLILTRGMLIDATQQAARTGAQVGDAGNPYTGASRQAFDRAIELNPGMSLDHVAAFTVEEGAPCGRYVTISSAYDFRFITPGLAQAAGIFTGQQTQEFATMRLDAASVARCEVTRSG